MGMTDVHILEQNQATSGTTWHAAGLIGTTRNTLTESKLSKLGSELYESLERETGLSPGFKRCGSLYVARNSDRMISLERLAARSLAFGNEIDVISAERCGELWNGLMDTSKLVGGLWIPNDGSGSPTDLTMSLLAGARQRGAQLHEDVSVESFQS